MKEYANSKDGDTVSFSKEEAKIIFDALSAHKFKIAQKKNSLSDTLKDSEQMMFLNQRLNAIESEIQKADLIFDKLGNIINRD